MSERHSRHTAVRSAVCLLILLLAGCSPASSRDLLWYQDSMTAASLTENESGRAWLVTVTDDGFTAMLTAPPCVAGIVFTVSGTESYAEAGAVRIPVEDAVLTGARRAACCLTLSPDGLSGIAPSTDGGVTAHFSAGETEYVLHIGEDGLPHQAEVIENGVSYRYEIAVEATP